jgi:lipopolysaccharide transport protein LptA
MKNAVLACLVCCACSGQLFAQSSASPTASPTPAKKAKEQKTGIDKLGAPATGGPITTEIFADEAFFDSSKNIGIFTGTVKVNDPRFNVQSDKLTVYVSKGENQGLEKAIAEGNVAVVRDKPDPNGGPPSRSVGRGETATYIASTGNVELRGDPRVQEGMNTHVAASPDTVMIINQNGQLTTHGPSRTEIRQQPNDDNKAKSSPSPKTTASPKR